MVKKHVGVSVCSSIREYFRRTEKNKMTLSVFIHTYGKMYLNGDLEAIEPKVRRCPKATTSFRVHESIIEGFKDDPLTIGEFINIYGRAYMNGALNVS